MIQSSVSLAQAALPAILLDRKSSPDHPLGRCGYYHDSSMLLVVHREIQHL